MSRVRRTSGGRWLFQAFAQALLWSSLAGSVLAQSAITSTLVPEPTVPERAWKFLVLHHTATTAGDVASIDAAHRQRTDSSGKPWLGIGYHFLIGNGNGMADGVVQPTFRWTEQLAGAHAGDASYNSLGLGICLVGNFEQAPPTPAQLRAVKQLVNELQARYQIADNSILGHGEIKGTACPGRYFPMHALANHSPAKLPSQSEGLTQTKSRNTGRRAEPRTDNFAQSGERKFSPVSARTMEGIRHVVTISRLGQRESSAGQAGPR